MIYPTITAFYAALLALMYLAMTSWVIGGRLSYEVLVGDGGHKDFEKRVRAHANFIEYVPFALILIGLLEAGGASFMLVHSLLLALLIARACHPFGMFAPVNSPRQFIFRGGGIVVTLVVILVAAIMLLLR